MQDITCKQCGEPYGVYSLRHEVSDWPDQPDNAYEMMMHGDGCPTCDWGEKAGDVSRSRVESQEEIERDHVKSLFDTDDDPMKYI